MKRINFNKKWTIKNYQFLILLAGLMLFTACTDVNEVFAPVLELSANQMTFRAEGETKTVKLNSNRTFTVTSSETWCKTEVLDGVFDNLKITVLPTDKIGKQRIAEITVSAPDAKETKMTVSQTGIDVILSLSESSISLANTDTEFSLEIVTNLSAITFDLPAWIHKKSETPQTEGKTLYVFTLDALESGETRKGTLTVKPVDAEITAMVSIPVEFGSTGVNKKNPFPIEAETSIEGHAAQKVDYWEQSGTMFGGEHFIDLPPNGEASYTIDILDNGNYNFTFDVASWGSDKPLELYIDNVFCGSVTVPASDGVHISQVTIAGVALPKTGSHKVKIKFQGNFGKFVIAWHSSPVESIAVHCSENLNNKELVTQPAWFNNGELFRKNPFLDGVRNVTIDFSVSISTPGIYSLTAAVICWAGNGAISALADGTEYGSAPVPQTNAATVDYITAGNMPLSAGVHKISVKFNDAPFCFEKLTVDFVRAGN